jgi:ribonuclease Z
MRIVFLGTSGSMPTQSRGASSLAIRRRGELIMLDCGEGTQRRMVEARLGFRRPMKVFISHLHGDHVLGLPGLLQTMTLLGRERALHVFGPEGLAGFIKAFSDVLGGPGFPLLVYEIQSDGVIFNGPEYDVTAVRADHEGQSWSFVLEEHPRPGRFHPEKAEALGVPAGPLWGRLQRGHDVEVDGRTVRSSEVVDPPRNGRKLAYSGDTRPNEAFIKASEGASVMIHEATFDGSLLDKAEEGGHSTTVQAAEVAARANAERLFLTHISARYPEAEALLQEAVEVFPDTTVAEDLMEYEMPH